MLSVECRENFEVKKLTSFKIGGPVKKVYFPASVEEFVEVLKAEPDAEVFGNLSNTLVSSDGYDGAIIITTKMAQVDITGTKVAAECGIKGPKLSQLVAKEGLSGLEFMIGFPGSLGGEVFMNASAKGQCVSDKLVKVKCYSRENGIFELKKEDMGFSYRTSRCQKDDIIILAVEFELDKKSADEIQAQMDVNLNFRKSHQPSLALPNCGSVFRNPEGNSAGRLLEEAGAKSFSVGGVHVWENHANFIINSDNGTSLDVLEIMYKMYSAVKEKFGIELRPEVRYLGGKNQREVELCRTLNIR